jgi:hypothetical protein
MYWGLHNMKKLALIVGLVAGVALAANPLTNEQLRRTPVPVSGSITASGTVDVTNNDLLLCQDATATTNANNIIATLTNFTTNVNVTGSVSAQGWDTNNAAISGRPVLQGIETTATGANPTAATANNVRRMVGDITGNIFVRPGSPNVWTCTLTALGATLTQCQAAPGAGLRLYVTDILVATTTATAGTWQAKYGTGTNCGTGTTNLTGFAAVAPISTAQVQSISFTTPLMPGAATQICVIGTATNTINIQVNGFVAP